jgi:hypothetical protein
MLPGMDEPVLDAGRSLNFMNDRRDLHEVRPRPHHARYAQVRHSDSLQLLCYGRHSFTLEGNTLK